METPEPGGSGSGSADEGGDDGDELPTLPHPTKRDDDGTPLCGVPLSSGDGECSHTVPNGVCSSHGDLKDRQRAADEGEYAIPDGTGSGDPGHSKGGGYGPEGNKNAMTHGGHVVKRDPFGVFDYLSDHNPEVLQQVLIRFWSWSHRADFPVYVYQDNAGPPDDARNALAELANKPPDEVDLPAVDPTVLSGPASELFKACLKSVLGERHTARQTSDGLTKEETRVSDTGTSYVVEVEDPGNLPADRLERQTLRTLKELGLLDDPESAKADAMGSWGDAAAAIAEREDSLDN